MTNEPVPEADVRLTLRTFGLSEAAADSARGDGAKVAAEISLRLREFGIHLLDMETVDELARLLEAVEGFEEAVERREGELTVETPIYGLEPIAVDVAAYLLPMRGDGESVASFLARIGEAASALRRMRERA